MKEELIGLVRRAGDPVQAGNRSEELDFALERPGRGGFDLAATSDRLVARLQREGYEVESKVRTDRVGPRGAACGGVEE